MALLSAERYVLENGLTLLIHTDKTTPLVVVNTLYKVGSRNEHSNRTGFAHLFEHLMFAGSRHVKNFDEVVQSAGGENNAFTNTDITNYYINLPAINLEVALWLEADRMQYLTINEETLDVQKKVVVEEFKQRYLNKPYGNASHLVRSLIYTVHPYRWPTIGLNPNHIEDANLKEVKQFYQNWYNPNNAILAIAGNVEVSKALELVNKYFCNIPSKPIPSLNLPIEPPKTSRTFSEVVYQVPASSLYLSFLMPNRNHPMYYAYDMISDILGNGKSSRLYQKLIKEKKIFQSINAYISGSIDAGYLIIEGKIHDDYSLEQAEEEVWKVIKNIPAEITEKEIEKVKNKYEANFISALVGIENKAALLAYYDFIFGNFEKINNEIEYYRKTDIQSICHLLENEIITEKSIVLYYKKS